MMARVFRSIALLLCVALAAPSCATLRAADARQPQDRDRRALPDAALMAEYVKQLPIGSRVRVERANGDTLRGTLMKATDEAIVVQKRTRIPEPPVEIPIADLRAVDLDQGGNTARTVAIAIGAGVGATLGVLLLLAAIFSD
jgi:hypothetical protein